MNIKSTKLKTTGELPKLFVTTLVVTISLLCGDAVTCFAQRADQSGNQLAVQQDNDRGDRPGELQPPVREQLGGSIALPMNQPNVAEIHLNQVGWWMLVNGQFVDGYSWDNYSGAWVRLGGQDDEVRIYGFTTENVFVRITDNSGDDFVENFTSTKLIFTGNNGSGDDLVIGGSGNDEIDGGVGNDFIFGRGGDDLLKGGYGHDWIYGDAGDDEIHGCGLAWENAPIYGGGDPTKPDFVQDVLFGGTGNDHFEDIQFLIYEIAIDQWSVLDTDLLMDFNPDQDVWRKAYGYFWLFY